MELYREILAHVLSSNISQSTAIYLQQQANQIVEGTCYRALTRIKAIIEDDSLDDDACFVKIEQIVCVLEEIGSSGGSRHDFG